MHAPLRVDVGFDLGTTTTKAVAVDLAGRVVAQAAMPTQWHSPHPGMAQRDAADTVADVESLLAQLSATLGGGVRIRSIGFASMAESGVLVDAQGREQAPVIAWFDPRGEEQVATAPAALGEAFTATTGLELGPLPSVFKLAWWREQGHDLSGLQWLSVPEFIISRLGGERAAEWSLLGRTGLLDVHTNAPWPLALEYLGVDEDFLPRRVGAGTPTGQVRADHPVEAIRGAVLTVGGHDHLVAAAAVGSGAPGSCLNSMGTAEAVVASIPSMPNPEMVELLAGQGFSAYPHVVAGATALISGGRTGVVYLRILHLLGAHSDEARGSLDAAAATLLRDWTPEQAAAITVEGFEMGQFEVVIRARTEEPTPAALWAATLVASNARLARLLHHLGEIGSPIENLVAVGGWTKMASVRAVRSMLNAQVTVSSLEEPGSWGAARFARWAAEQRGATDDPRPPADWFVTDAGGH